MNDERPTDRPGPTRLLLLRHGETAAPHLFHGSESDIGLGARGFEQALSAARDLAARRPAAIYCSGMRRAVETARPIAEACGLTLRFEPDLRERAMGPLSGFPRMEGMPIYDETKARWMAGETDFTHDGGESFDDIRARVVPALNRIADRHPGETVVFVGHGVANRVAIVSVVEGLSHANFDDITLEFVKVTSLRRDGCVWTIEPDA